MSFMEQLFMKGGGRGEEMGESLGGVLYTRGVEVFA